VSRAEIGEKEAGQSRREESVFRREAGGDVDTMSRECMGECECEWVIDLG
jgi:hypothetical protein